MNSTGKPAAAQDSHKHGSSDEFSVFLRGVVHSSGHGLEHQDASTEALFSELVAFLRQPGGDRFAVRLWQALKHLPEVQAYERDVLEAHRFFTQGSFNVRFAESRRLVSKFIHDNPSLFEGLVDR